MKQKRRTKHMDMLHGPIWSKLPQYALPVAATGILEQLFNASDLAIVGNFTGANKTIAVAAVGANTSVIGLILNLFIGIALGVNVVIANAIGKKDHEMIKKSVHTAIMMSLIGGLIVLVIGQIGVATLMKALNVPDEVMPYALTYIRIYLIGMPVILLYNFEAAIFRSVGDTKVPLQALAVSGCLNVVLNLFFVLVFHMTVSGVAIATVLSNVVSSMILLHKLVHTDKEVKVCIKDLKIDAKSLGKILRIGMPSGVQSAVFSVANIVLQAAVNSLGTVVIAASSAAFNIEIVAYYVLNSFSQACTTFVGQNHGAGKFDRCKKVMVLCIIEDFIATGIISAAVLVSGRYLLTIFNSDPKVVEIGYVRLVVVLFAYIFSILYENMAGYLRGFGISMAPAILTIIGVCVVRIAWVCIEFPIHHTFRTIMMAFPVSLSITALLMAALLMILKPSKIEERRGKNKQLKPCVKIG